MKLNRVQTDNITIVQSDNGDMTVIGKYTNSRYTSDLVWLYLRALDRGIVDEWNDLVDIISMLLKRQDQA